MMTGERLDGKAADERFVEALEQVDVLRFLAREIEERTNPPVVVAKIVPRMVHQEWKDELLHDSEDAQILVRADLVEDALFERIQGFDAGRAGGLTLRAATALRRRLL